VRQFLRRTHDGIFVRRFHPEQELRLPAPEVKRMYRITGSAELGQARVPLRRYRSRVRPLRSISARSPEITSAITRPEPAAIVQPSVP